MAKGPRKVIAMGTNQHVGKDSANGSVPAWADDGWRED
jgi:hypothetical protein